MNTRTASEEESMNENWKEMEVQLERWSVRIDQLAAKCQAVGVQPGFEALNHLDELKALHAIAKAKLEELMAARRGPGQIQLEVEMMVAWEDLRAAVEKPA